MNQLGTPIAFIVFNRPEPTRRVFAAIAAARPSRLLLIADGPRANRSGEAQRCEEVRRIVSAVDWPCKVETNFSVENLGCKRRMISGLNWVFSLVEEAIILEDDCLPDPTFFPYCAQLLDRYRDCEQVGIISGFNPLQKSFPFPFPYSYHFTRLALIWGWATWRRTWKHYDEKMTSWPQVKEGGMLRLMWKEKRSFDGWTRIFDGMHSGTGPDAWSYQLIYSLWMRNALNIIPRRNLIQNIGFGDDATHTTRADAGLKIPAHTLDLPLAHPPAIIDWPDYALAHEQRFIWPSLARRARTKLEVLLKSDIYK
jgi:hypothetical protein